MKTSLPITKGGGRYPHPFEEGEVERGGGEASCTGPLIQRAEIEEYPPGFILYIQLYEPDMEPNSKSMMLLSLSSVCCSSLLRSKASVC